MLILGIRFIVVLIIVTERAADLVGIAFTAAQTIIAGIRSLRTSGRTGAYGVSEIIAMAKGSSMIALFSRTAFIADIYVISSFGASSRNCCSIYKHMCSTSGAASGTACMRVSRHSLRVAALFVTLISKDHNCLSIVVLLRARLHWRIKLIRILCRNVK